MASGTFLPPGLSRSIVKIESGGTNNYVMTAVDGETIQGEANLIFDGTKLGIGTDDPDAILHVYGGASGATPHDRARLIIEDDTHCDLQFLAPASGGDMAVRFGDPDESSAGYIQYSSSDVMFLATSADNTIAISGGTTAAMSLYGAATISNTSGVLTLTPSGNMGIQVATDYVFINAADTTNTVFALRDTTDVATGFTSVSHPDVTTNDFFAISKTTNGTAGGGATMMSIHENSAVGSVMNFKSFGGTAVTTKNVSQAGLVDILVSQHDGSNGIDDVTSDGNVFTIRARTGGADATRLLIDEAGSIYAVAAPVSGDIAVGAIADGYDDAQLARAFDHAKTSAGAKGMIKSKWDDFINYNEQDLIDARILGDTMENGGLLNVTGLQKLHNGAIWQGYVRQQEMQERIDTMESRLLAIEGAK